MKQVVSYIEISCDGCGAPMTEESTKDYIHDVYLGNNYAHATIDMTAIVNGREKRCLCNQCKKEILQRAIEGLV